MPLKISHLKIPPYYHLKCFANLIRKNNNFSVFVPITMEIRLRIENKKKKFDIDHQTTNDNTK
jgi:hypothetical protein